MGDVVPFRGDVIVADARDDEGPFQPDPTLIEALERALARAHSGELVAFVLIYHGETDPAPKVAYNTIGGDLHTLLAGMAVEQHRMTGYLAENTEEIQQPDEGA